MINAPQSVIDKLVSGNFSYGDIISINLGDAYGTGEDVIINTTTYAHSLSFGGVNYSTDNNIREIDGISRKASTGSDKVDIVFDITDEAIIDAIKSERYINKPTSISRVIVEDGVIVGDFAIPIRTAWGLSHQSSGDTDDRTITLTLDSSLGDLTGDNGWYAINSSHQRRYPNDLIMNHSGTVMTEDQQNKYTSNFSGVISQQVKPPALPKIYGYKNVEAVPVAMLKHRKTHTSYRHYFTTLIYVLNIGDCEDIDIRNIRKGGDDFDINIVNSNSTDVGGWSCRAFNATESGVNVATDSRLNFWREGMDSGERSRLTGMYGKGLTLLFVKNRNRDDWISQAPKITIPVKGSLVYNPDTGLKEYSRNPALQYADFLRSEKYGAGQRGIGVSDANLSELKAHFEQIPDSLNNDGINSIMIDVQLDTGEPIVDNMNIWMEGVRLFTSDYYGQFNIRVETKSPVVIHIDEDDLEETPDYESGEFTERLNQLTYSIKQLVPDNSEDAIAGDLVEVDVEATFPADGSQTHTDWLSQDGGIDNFDSESLDYVTDLEQAYYWAMVDARISRQQRKLELPMGALAWLLEVGDVFTFSSEILNINSDLKWRVDEVSEDDSVTTVSSRSYDDNFYTPDPNAIPAPVAFAQPPTGSELSPVSGLAVIERSGLYYLDWSPLSSANVVWYAVEVEKDGVLVIDNPRVAQPPLMMENITIGSYEARVVAIGHEDEGFLSTLQFDIALPETPTINITVGNFSLEIYPTVSKTYLGSTFELAINNSDDFNTAQNKGTSGSFTVANLVPNTHYWVWVRTINIVGVSDWARADAITLNDNSTLVGFVGIDRESIINDAVDELQGQVNEAIDGALESVIDNIASDALEEAQDQIAKLGNENSQQNTVNLINDIFANTKTVKESFDNNALQKIETSELKVELGNVSASLSETKQVIVDESKSMALQVNTLSSAISNSNAKINQTNQTVATLDSSTSTSLQQLSSGINDNTADISTLNQTVATLDSSTSTSLQQLNAQVNTKATISALNQVESKADNTANALSALDASVQNLDGEVSSAQLILNSHTNDIGELSSRAFLGVDVSGNISGIHINGSASESEMEFLADQISFVNPDTGLKDLVYDAASNRLLFGGIITANTLIQSPKIELIGSTHVRVVSATGFGSNNQFIEWFGPRIITGGSIDYSAMSESNAITYLKADGSAYFGGSIISGSLSNSLTTSTLDGDAKVGIGPYGSNGGVIAINCSVSLYSRYYRIQTEQDSTEPAIPSCTITLQEYVGASWVTRQSARFVGQSSVSNDYEGNGQYVVNEVVSLSGSFTYTDNKATTSDRMYRVVMSQRTNFRTLSPWVASQRLSINSQED